MSHFLSLYTYYRIVQAKECSRYLKSHAAVKNIYRYIKAQKENLCEKLGCTPEVIRDIKRNAIIYKKKGKKNVDALELAAQQIQKKDYKRK